jgi:hypothetical protein
MRLALFCRLVGRLRIGNDAARLSYCARQVKRFAWRYMELSFPFS